MARTIKVWWNHETFALRIPFNDEDGPCVLVVPPGGSVQLDDRYTRFRSDGGDGIIENVDGISPHLRPNKPVEGDKRKVEVVTGVDERGYAKTKTVTVTTPAPFEGPPTIADPPAKFNPNRRQVTADKFTG